MHKYIIPLIAAAALVTPAIASANLSVVTDSGASILCSDATTTENINTCNGAGGGVIVGLLQEPWGLTYNQSLGLVVPAGTVITDEGGITTGMCPWFMGQGCFNLTSLDYWKMQARYVARHGDARFFYWLTH